MALLLEREDPLQRPKADGALGTPWIFGWLTPSPLQVELAIPRTRPRTLRHAAWGDVDLDYPAA